MPASTSTSPQPAIPRTYLDARLDQTLTDLLAESPERPIALMPAGRYTRMLLERRRPGRDMPAVAFILDDGPAADTLAGIPVLRPEDAPPGLVQAIVIASDAHTDTLRERAEAWAATAERTPRLITIDSATTADPAASITGCAPAHPDAPPGTFPARMDVNGYAEHHGDGYTVSRAEWSVRGIVRFPRHQTMPGTPLRKKDRLDVAEYPTHEEPGLITPSTPVSALGSCFAERLRGWLIEHGYNYCQWEDGPAMNGSLNCSTIFNSGSMRQLFEWGLNGFNAAEEYWSINGTPTDPYRQFLQWPDERSMRAERAAHAAAVQRMVRGSSVLILTLGMSEVWRSRLDQSCFAWLPPKAIKDDARHECVVLTPEENLANLERVRELCLAHNPALRLVVSLSPVPMIATQFDRHAMVSDTASKASLRAAIDMFCRRHKDTIYFPSYEMVARSPRWAYDKDNWHVSDPSVIGTIMSRFIACYGNDAGAIPAAVAG